MLVAGLACSHAPTMFLETRDWDGVYQRLIRDVPQPSAAKDETGQVAAELRDRVLHGFATLRAVLDQSAPDVIIIIGDDQDEVFGKAYNPTLAVYVGPEASGTANIGLAGQPEHENHVKLTTHPAFAAHLVRGLVERHFDPALLQEIVPLSRPDRGLGHAFVRPAVALGLDTRPGAAIVPVFLNAYHPPLPSARRCWDLGVAIAEIANEWPGRVAIIGSGGLSHDPGGPRAGWIDDRLDRWVLDRIESGRTRELTGLFTFESATLRGGTGEIRSWIAVAGAYADQPGTVVDYIPIHKAVTGLSFAYWLS